MGINLLGRLAAFARRLGFDPLIRGLRELLDKFCMRAGVFPLGVDCDGVKLRGLFRHRSFLMSLLSNYEPYTRRLFLEALKEDTLVVDGGAHIGWYTCLAARHLFNGRIISVEPDPFNFAALAYNCRKLSNVTLVQKALGNIDGKATFFSDYGTIGSSLIVRAERRHKHPIEVEVITIDTLLSGWKATHLLLKLDLEGAEPLALQGMNATFQQFPEITIILEHNPDALRDGGYSYHDILEALWSNGFNTYFIDELEGVLIPIKELLPLPKGNLFARRKK